MDDPTETTPTTLHPQERQSSDRPAYVGEPVPNALGAEELMRVLNLRPATFYAYMRAGKLKRFEFQRPVSYTKRYSGTLVKRYLDQSGSGS